MLTQKDLYDYITKNGADAYDAMAKELADNINAAKAKFEADQKKKAEETKLADQRRTDLSYAIKNWFGDDYFNPLTCDQVAKSMYQALEDFGKKTDTIMKHAKDVKTETTKIPGGTKTVTTGTLDSKDVDALISDIVSEFRKTFKW